jgi:hypothetical protein
MARRRSVSTEGRGIDQEDETVGERRPSQLRAAPPPRHLPRQSQVGRIREVAPVRAVREERRPE